MDSGLGSDEDRRSRTTKEQKQRLNQQLVSGCFIDAASLTDDGIGEVARLRDDERRQGALIFQTSIPQFSTMLQREEEPCSSSCASLSIEPDTPYNSIVQLDDGKEGSGSYKTPLGFYVDLNEIEEPAEVASGPSSSGKKNIFSMVIDFEAPKKDMPSRLSSSLVSRRKIGGDRPQQVNGAVKKELQGVKKKSSVGSGRLSRSCNGFNGSSGNSEKFGVSKTNSGVNGAVRSKSSSDESLPDDGEQSPVQKFETEEEEKIVTKIIQDLQVQSTSSLSLQQINDSQDRSNQNEQTAQNDKIEEKSNATETEVEIETEKSNNATQKFVKLSDLERQSPRADFSLAPKMSRSIPESSWVESPLLMSRSAGYRSAPHPIEPEPDELSDEATQDIPTPRNSVQRLGTDLLRMFLEEIGPDVTVEVDGHRLKAHKCILASRCQYFAAMLSGNWLEAEGNVISLQGFSYESVYFALCHIYSGAAHVPDSISLVELASLSDMLGLEGLKEVVEHALKQRHCHNFHRPCAGCCTGVVEVLPLAAACGLDTLYQKCLQWITQYFSKVWPSRAFAALPKELREKCYQQHIVHMSSENVLETTLACEKLLSSTPSLRWAEPILQMGLQLADACQIYTRQHFTAVLSSSSFSQLESAADWNVAQIEEYLLSAAHILGPEQACRSYVKCHRMLERSYSQRFMQMIVKMKVQVEGCVLGQIEKAIRCPGWTRMDPVLRNRIKELSGLSLDDPPHTRLPRATTARLKKYNQAQSSKPNAVSSSDSSRNSSPGMNQSQPHVFGKSSGSPSLRRSLLLAARAPQVPPSPSTHRRSTLTQPTQASAAKSAPSRNLKAPQITQTKPVPSKQPQPKSAPIKTITARNNALNKSSSTGAVIQRKPTVNSRPDSGKRLQNFSGIKKQPQVEGNIVAKSSSSGSIPVSPKKAVKSTAGSGRPDNSTPQVVRKTTMQRSDTFLKEGPTVLKRV